MSHDTPGGSSSTPAFHTMMGHLDNGSLEGEHHELGHLSRAIEAVGLVKAESMDLSNDPRYYADNVINYRITAFAGLSVVSGLMLQNAYDRAFDMKKHMGIFNRAGHVDIDYVCQFLGFMLLVFVIMVNMLSVYVGVVQPYHTIRLITAGQMGFEMSASYYLNKNICFWRHFAIRMMLLSMPAFALSTGFRLIVRFDRDNQQGEEISSQFPPMEEHVEGFFFAALFLIMGLFLFYVHRVHFAVFNDRYQCMMTPPAIVTNMRTLMTPRVNSMWAGTDV